MARKKILGALLIALGCLNSVSWAKGELAVVVSAKNQIATLTSKEVASIFLGKNRVMPDGTKVIPLDQFEGQSARFEFYSKVVNKTPNQLNSYWSRLIFTVKGQPPFAVSGDEEVLEFVSSNPNMIGYVAVDNLSTSSLSENVKVLLTVE